MGKRLLLIDSDMFIILSAAGLLERTVEILGFELQNCRRLDALNRQLQRGKGFKERYSAGVRDAVLSCCDKISSLTERPSDPDLLDQLVSVEDIGRCPNHR